MALLGFGETHPDYSVKVLNEREARAGAGILLFFGVIAFLTAFQKGDFTLTRIATVFFGVDFFLRVAVSPRYALSLVIGRFMVRNQTPEYAGAPQKQFAWALGLAIAVVMGVWMIGPNLAGPVAILGCLICILLLFFETAFGICVGCKIYNAIWPGMAQHCPGGVCAIQRREARSSRLAGAGCVGRWTGDDCCSFCPASGRTVRTVMPRMGASAKADGDCTVPAFAIAIGHEEMWKQHNGCN